MKSFISPEPFKSDGKFTLFLAGSIEMGKAEDWQVEFTEAFKVFDINILNPRRLGWDSSWIQSRDNLEFYEQVQWELHGLGSSDLILMYLQPGTISPISLLELGLYANSSKLLVCCPSEFGRSGNVHIVCEHYHIPFCTYKEEFLTIASNIIRRKG